MRVICAWRKKMYITKIGVRQHREKVQSYKIEIFLFFFGGFVEAAEFAFPLVKAAPLLRLYVNHWQACIHSITLFRWVQINECVFFLLFFLTKQRRCWRTMALSLFLHFSRTHRATSIYKELYISQKWFSFGNFSLVYSCSHDAIVISTDVDFMPLSSPPFSNFSCSFSATLPSALHTPPFLIVQNHSFIFCYIFYSCGSFSLNKFPCDCI